MNKALCGLRFMKPAVDQAFTLGKLAAFNRDVAIQEVNELGFGAGGGRVVHSKGRVERGKRGASFIS